MSRFAAIVVALGVAFSLPIEAAQPHLKKGVRYRLYFPVIPLAKEDGERISAVKVVVQCGRFRGVSSIPNDWSVEVIGPSSEETTFRASAGHGSTALWSIKDWNGVIAIAADPSCFDISAEVTSEMSDKVKKHSFNSKQLRLRP